MQFRVLIFRINVSVLGIKLTFVNCILNVQNEPEQYKTVSSTTFKFCHSILHLWHYCKFDTSFILHNN